MNKYIFGSLFLFMPGLLHPNDCPQPHTGSTMKLLVTNSDMIVAKEEAAKEGKNAVVLSEVLKRLGYTTKESQEKFASQIKADTGLDKNPDYQNMAVDAFDLSLYGDTSLTSNLFILMVGDSFDSEYYYYFFQKNGNNYSLIKKDPIESYSKYCGSFPDNYSYEGKDYVVLVGSGGGTGVLICDAELYEVSKNSVSKILEYTFSGHSFPWRLDEEFAAGPITIFSNSFGKTLQMPFKVSFCVYGEGNPQPQIELFSKTYTLNYDWSFFHQSYVLNVASSGITFNVEKDADLYGLASTVVFKRYYDELNNIAQNGNPAQKQWLRDFLADDEMNSLKNTADVKRLESFLGK